MRRSTLPTVAGILAALVTSTLVVADGRHPQVAAVTVAAAPAAEPAPVPTRHSSSLLEATSAADGDLLGAELAGDLTAALLPLAHEARDLAWLSSTLPPAWVVASALPYDLTSAEHPDLRPLVASPVPGCESSGYGWRDDPLQHFRKFHKGTDYRAPRGTKVFAAGGGTVIIAGQQHGYGNVIYVDHGGGVITRYGHLSKIIARRGQQVPAGTLIGLVGATGRATGPHLHFEIRIGGRAVDPVLAMHVAELQRTDPGAARVAEAALAPEVQDASLDRDDATNRAAKRRGHRSDGPRPERRGRGKRVQVLW